MVERGEYGNEIIQKPKPPFILNLTKMEQQQGYRSYYPNLEGDIKHFIQELWHNGYRVVSTIKISKDEILFIIEKP